MAKLTQKEIERRERFLVYGDLSAEDVAEIRRLYFERRCDPADIAGQFETDMATVFKIVTSGSGSERRTERE